MKPGLYINARGETVITFGVFKAMDTHAVMSAIRPQRSKVLTPSERHEVAQATDSYTGGTLA